MGGGEPGDSVRVSEDESTGVITVLHVVISAGFLWPRRTPLKSDDVVIHDFEIPNFYTRL